MKVVEDTPARIIVVSRRKVLADFTFLFFLCMGALIVFAMSQESFRDGPSYLALCLGLLFVGIGAWGLLKNAADHVTLDAASRTVTIQRRRIFGRNSVSIPFSEITRISVHEDDGMHTIAFSVKDQNDILLETAYGTNPKAFHLARRLNDWLIEARAQSTAT